MEEQEILLQLQQMLLSCDLTGRLVLSHASAGAELGIECGNPRPEGPAQTALCVPGVQNQNHGQLTGQGIDSLGWHCSFFGKTTNKHN